MPTTGSKRALAPSAPATPPTSPFSAVKRVRLTYTSTNEALVELNAAKEEASLAYISNSGIHPELVETAPKGKGRYKVQWGGKPKSFLMIGTVSAHDVVIKKEVCPHLYESYIDLSRQIRSLKSLLLEIKST